METEITTEVINMHPTADFLSGEELVGLRKPEELVPQISMGQKFSECNRTEAEKEAVDCALDSQKAILSQKRGTRICDLMQAEWNEELNVSVATKLKGKFVQHMGHREDDKIILTPEESLFLLENGCLEIIHDKAPMSTEEAYAAMLKKRLSVEKYIVYSYLSQLGFIVVPHQKEIKSKLQNKATIVERNKKKRKIQSPLPEDSRNKRLTFSGVFSEEANSDKDSKILEESKSLLNDIAVISKVQPSPAQTEESKPAGSENELQSVASPSNILESSKTDIDKEDQLQSSYSEVVLSPPHNHLENSKTDDVEIESEVDESSSVKPSQSASTANVDVDSRSTDLLMDSLEKSTGVFVAEGANIDVTSQSSDSQCAVINDTSDVDDQNSVLSLSSYDYNELEDSRDETSGGANLIVDDDITLVEITKKETTPLAVIDLLSDDEEPMETEEANVRDDSESDDDIKILEVCNGSTNSGKNKEIPVNLNKIKSQKMGNFKRDQCIARTPVATPRIQFPELFRKDLVCVARPFLNLLPLHTLPGKEVYILDCSKLQQTNRGSHPSTTVSQPQGRLWNSFRDMQDYQRSLRRNRQFNRHQNQDRPWQRGPRHFGEMPYRRLPSYHNNNLSSARERNDHISPFNNSNRHSDADYREHSPLSRNKHDSDYRNHNGSEEQKPFVSSRSPALLGDNPSESVPPRIPHFSNPNSPWARHPAPNFPPGNPLDLHNPPGGMSGLTSQEFVAEVHRTAYSYATTMLSSMFGSAFNPTNFSTLAPRPPFGFPRPMPHIDGQNSRNLSSPFANEYYPMPNSRQPHGDFPRNRRYHRTEPFPCHYRNIQNKKSWNDVRVAVSGEKEKSESESSDIEEIPININEFLWNASNICPLVKPGIKHPLADVLNPLKLTQIAKLTDKACRNEKYFSDNQILEINFDVYKPGTHFKKSSPGTPNLRIIVMKASDPVPRYSEIAFLQRKWDDGASIQIALVDNADISFYSFSSICIPHIVPLQD